MILPFILTNSRPPKKVRPSDPLFKDVCRRIGALKSIGARVKVEQILGRADFALRAVSVKTFGLVQHGLNWIVHET